MVAVRARKVLAATSVLAVLFIPTAVGTPNPTSVTVAGSMQSELGCASDWDASCATTHLTYDANDDVWQGVFTIPAGSWEYKAALNDSWTENYGLHAQPNGPNIPLSLGSSTAVKFFYDHKSHWITDNHSSVIATAPGSYQSELGCSSDWDPGCLRSWLEDPSGSGTYSFSTTALPAGAYEAKAAINEDWTENYGLGGVPNGPNIPFTVPADNTPMDFVYNPISHVLTIMSATAVTFRSFIAVRSRRGVVLGWRTAAEADTLGFNVYRAREGARHRLNQRLIASHGAVAGRAYSFLDRRAGRGGRLSYWLQIVDRDGGKVWHGPARPRRR
jgi:Pullulanase X25 domain